MHIYIYIQYMYVYTIAFSPINLSYFYMSFTQPLQYTWISHRIPLWMTSSFCTNIFASLLWRRSVFWHCICVNEYLQCFFPLHEYKFTSSFKFLHIFAHITFGIVQFICFISASSLCLLHLSSFFLLRRPSLADICFLEVNVFRAR